MNAKIAQTRAILGEGVSTADLKAVLARDVDAAIRVLRQADQGKEFAELKVAFDLLDFPLDALEGEMLYRDMGAEEEQRR
jgi:hypothetical protein